MRRNLIITLTLITLLVGGCVVQSFYPLYSEDVLTTDDQLLGNWTDQDSGTWNFSYHESKEYYLLKLDSPAAHFEVHMVELDGKLYLNFHIKRFEVKNEFALVNLMPVHSFARLKLNKKSMELDWMSEEWLRSKIEKGEITIDHLKMDTRLLVVGNTEALQKLVREHGKDDKAYENSLSYQLIRN